MGLWWLQPGWTDTRCSRCGRKIWPHGDPDHGVCYECFNERFQQHPEPEGPEPEDPAPESPGEERTEMKKCAVCEMVIPAVSEHNHMREHIKESNADPDSDVPAVLDVNLEAVAERGEQVENALRRAIALAGYLLAGGKSPELILSRAQEVNAACEEALHLLQG